MIELALTKIGDLLVNNKITVSYEGKEIDGVNLNIPPYQRPYKWSTKNVYQLIEDIEKAKSDNKEVYRL